MRSPGNRFVSTSEARRQAFEMGQAVFYWQDCVLALVVESGPEHISGKQKSAYPTHA
jgi:sulfur relay (sulfurtransferase) DsrF/TusC family protein